MNPELIQLLQQYLGNLGQPNPNLPQQSAPAVKIPYATDADRNVNHPLPYTNFPKEYMQGGNRGYNDQGLIAVLQELSRPSAIQHLYQNPLYSKDVSALNQEQNQLMYNLPRTRAERPKHNK